MIHRLIWGLGAFVTMVAGLYLLFNPWNMSDGSQAVLGVLIILIGVFLSNIMGGASLGIMLLGLYFLARSIGLADHQYLRYILGLGLSGLALFSFYKLLQATDSKKPSS